jgi:hypothetical protein
MPLSLALAVVIALSRSLARAFSLFEEDDRIRKTTFNPPAHNKKSMLEM